MIQHHPHSVAHPAADEIDHAMELDFIRGLAHRVTRGAWYADDLAQDTWLAARKQSRLALHNREAWFRRVMLRLLANRFHSERARRQRESASAREESVWDAEPESERSDLRRRVRSELDALEAKYREALRLRFMDDLSPDEVSRRLGVPLETARTRIKRGQTALRRRIERWSTPAEPRSLT